MRDKFIDNSGLSKFWECPGKFYEQYRRGFSKEWPSLAFGSRWHAVLKSYYDSFLSGVINIPPKPDSFSQADENVIQSMFEAYKAHYPVENFEVLDTEKYFEIPLGNGWTYVGQIDMRVRDKTTGARSIFETKTEKRGSKANYPEAWRTRTQGSLYMWADSILFPNDPADNIILNICTKPSDKGQIGPGFRRDTLERTPEQLNRALENLKRTCELIEWQDDHMWPSSSFNYNACVDRMGFSCEYTPEHHYGIEREMDPGLVKIEPFSHLSM